jgi:hypothetical protein
MAEDSLAVGGLGYPAAMGVIDWLLEGDPAIRWQVLRDLTDDEGNGRARYWSPAPADDGRWGSDTP